MGRQPGNGVDSLGGRPKQRPHDPVEGGQRVGESRGVRPSGMHGGKGDPAPGQATIPLPHQGHLGPLRARVGERAVVLAAPVLEVAEVEALGVHPTARDGDHARSRRAPQERQKLCDEHEWGQGQDRQGRLAPVGPLRPLRVDRPGVVDDDVEARLRRRDPGGGGSHRGQRAHVDHDDGKAVFTVEEHQLVAQPGEPLLAAAGKDDPRPEGGQRAGSRPTKPRRRAGDQDGPAGERPGWRRSPAEETSPDHRPDPAEAADDGDLERVVDDRPWVQAHGRKVPKKTCQARIVFANSDRNM